MANNPTATTSRPDFKEKAETYGANGGRKTGEALDKAGAKADDAASGVVQKVQDMASNVAHKAQDVASDISGSVEDAYTATSEKMGEFNKDVMKLIHQHPKQAVLLGFGIGCLLGAVVLGGVFATNRR